MGRDVAFFSVTSQQLKNGSRDIKVPDILKSVTPGTFFTASPTCLCHSEVRRQGLLAPLLSLPASWSARTKSEGEEEPGVFQQGLSHIQELKTEACEFPRHLPTPETCSWSERGKVRDCEYME